MHITTVIKVPLRAMRTAYRGLRTLRGVESTDTTTATTAAVSPPEPEPTPEPEPEPTPPPVVEAPREPRTVTVYAEPTPNPNARKFVCSVTVVERGSRAFDDARMASSDPVASALFAVPGVRSTFAVRDFVTVTREPHASWQSLEPAIEAALVEALA